ncbi:branched-chain amino acid ABC transporter permease [Actinoallomurus bryophytorum]|uniref:Branched-chain amino acid transport system permease protein n=1 Tax=Actinoallomurus bryophytorum TaxID=1490222 RepID=A0A543BZQ2_9ACTN|nr:branched-chain amino acid ABC transporter permease [Actinoallomurus bryophytorum]TQL90299.1 branched-chain amino acid transport system permease protein [Actinoallomurus bryophytorum]
MKRSLAARPSAGLVTAVVVAVAAVLAPVLLQGSQVSVYVLLLLAATVVTGLSMLMGYAGQVSLGQGSFYLIGAYTAALIATHGMPTWLGLLAAPVAAAGIAALVGVPLLRLRGHQLAFATLAIQLILLSLAGRQEWAGGDIGLQGVPRLEIAGYEFAGDASYAYLALGALALVALITRNVVASRPGRGLRALATSEVAAASSGVPVPAYKQAVFSLSAGYAGLAGGIYAFYIGYVAPGSFPVLQSFEYVVMVAVGGAGTVWGALAGATAITLLIQLLNNVGTMDGMPAAAPTVLSYAVYGALLILSVLFLPRGLAPSVAAWWERRAARRRPPPGDSSVPSPHDLAGTPS